MHGGIYSRKPSRQHSFAIPLNNIQYKATNIDWVCNRANGWNLTLDRGVIPYDAYDGSIGIISATIGGFFAFSRKNGSN